jgi:chorismate synthase
VNTWGRHIRLSIFGESHGKAIGVIIDGLPAGESIDEERIAVEMSRRAPGGTEFSTARNESDLAEILSGTLNGKTTGAPLCAMIRNNDARSGDYGKAIRPGHADWTALLKYSGHADMRGGGHFSGRLTAPLVFAGALAKQIIGGRGVKVFGRVLSVGNLKDTETPATADEWEKISMARFPASEGVRDAMQALILEAKGEGDSVGGIVEAAALGVPGGCGEPFFGALESVAAAMMFSIPGVKGLEFGGGFALTHMRGSEANDELYVEDGIIRSRTNNNGGILGGISNGAPIILRVAIKPTASIAKVQRTVDPEHMTNVELEIKGRHDPCIAPRATPVVEAGLALSILECMS